MERWSEDPKVIIRINVGRPFIAVLIIVCLALFGLLKLGNYVDKRASVSSNPLVSPISYALNRYDAGRKYQAKVLNSTPMTPWNIAKFGMSNKVNLFLEYCSSLLSEKETMHSIRLVEYNKQGQKIDEVVYNEATSQFEDIYDTSVSKERKSLNSIIEKRSTAKIERNH